MGNQYISECQIITNNVAVTGSFTAGCYLGTVVRSVAGRSGNVTLSYGDIAGAPQAGATAQALGVTANGGTNPSFSRSDHVHPACIQTSPQPTDYGLGLATTEYVKSQAHLVDATILPSNPSGGKSGSDKYAGPGQYLFALGQHQHPSDTTKLNVSGGSLTGNVSGTGAFFNYISASQFAGDGSLLTNLVSQDTTKLPLAGGTLTGGLTGTTARFNSLSGDGSLLYNVFGTDTSKMPIAGGTFTGSITGTTACFTDLCATRLFGDGSGLTNLLKPNEQLKFDSINISDSPSNGQQIGYRTGTPQNESLNVGYQACSTGICSTVIGNSAIGGIGASVLGLAASAGTCSVAVGFSSKASNSAGSTAIGACASVSSSSTASESVAIGFSSCAGTHATSVGSKADARNCGVAVGQGANAGVGGGTAIGTQTQACNTGTAVGCAANAVNQGASVGAVSNACDKGAAVGFSAIACNGGVAVGYTAYSPISGVAIGCCANAGETGNVAIGTGAKATSLDVAIGNFASANTNATALGDHANASNDSIAIGKNSTASSNSIAIGNNTTTLNNQIVIGSINSLAADKTNLTIIGNNIHSIGECSVNIGYNISSTDSATVIGIKSSASPCSVVIGDDSCSVMIKTVDSGPSIVVGNKIIAKEASVAVGYSNLVEDESIGIGSHIISTGRSFAGGDCACASGNSIGIGYCVDAEVCSLSLGNCSYACDRSTAAGYGAIAAIGSTSIGCGAWSRCFSTVIGIHSGAVTYGSIGIGPDAKIRGFCIKDICSALDFSNFPHAYALSKTTSLSPVICDVGLGYATCPQLYIPGANISGCGIPRDTVICTVTPDPTAKCKVRLTLSNVVLPGFNSNSNLLKITHPYVCFQDAEIACGCNILCISSTSPEDEKGVYRRLFNANANLTACDTFGSSSCQRIDGFYGGHIHCGRLPGCGDLYSNPPECFPSYTNVRCALYDNWGSAILIEENTPGQGTLRRVNLSTGLPTKFACTLISCSVVPENLSNSLANCRQILLDTRYSFASDGRYLYVADACTHTLGFIDLTDAYPTKNALAGSVIGNNRNILSIPFPGCYGAASTLTTAEGVGYFLNRDWHPMISTASNFLTRLDSNWSANNYLEKQRVQVSVTNLPNLTKYTDWTNLPNRNWTIQPLISTSFLSTNDSYIFTEFGFDIRNGSGQPNEPGGPYFFINPLSGGTVEKVGNDIFYGRLPSDHKLTHPGGLYNSALRSIAETNLLSAVRFNEPRFLQYVYDEGTKEKSLYVINTGRKIYINGVGYEVDGSYGPAFGYLIFKIRLMPVTNTVYQAPLSSYPFAQSVTPIASLNRVVSGLNTGTSLSFFKTITDITGMTVDPKGNIFVSCKARDTRLEGFSAVRFYDSYNNADGQYLSDFIIKIPNTETLLHNSHTFASSKSAIAINNGAVYPNFRHPQHMAIDKNDNLLIVDAMIHDDGAKAPYTNSGLPTTGKYAQGIYTRIRKIDPQGRVTTLQTLGSAFNAGKLGAAGIDNFDGAKCADQSTGVVFYSTLSSVYYPNFVGTTSNAYSGNNTAGYGIAYDPQTNNLFISCRTNYSIQVLTPHSTLPEVYLQSRFAGSPTGIVPEKVPSGSTLDENLNSPPIGNRLTFQLYGPRGLCLDWQGTSVPTKTGIGVPDITTVQPTARLVLPNPSSGILGSALEVSTTITGASYRIISGGTKYLYVAEETSNTIKRITVDLSSNAGDVVTIAGGVNNGDGSTWTFNHPNLPSSSNSYNLFNGTTNGVGKPLSAYNYNPSISLSGSNFRTWDEGYTNTSNKQNVGINALFKNPTHCILSNNGQYLYVSDTGNLAIRRITLWEKSSTSEDIIPYIVNYSTTTKIISGDKNRTVLSTVEDKKLISLAPVHTVAGRPPGSSTSQQFIDGNGNDARFFKPQQLTIEELPNGITNLYVADGADSATSENGCIRKITIPANWNGITSQTTVTTFVGPNNGAYYQSRFGVPGARVGIHSPRGLVRDRNGNFYVSEYQNSMIRKISPQGLVVDYAGTATKTNLVNTISTPVNYPIVDSNAIHNNAEANTAIYSRVAAETLQTVSSSTENPTVYKNVNKDWRTILAGSYSGIPFSAFSRRLSSIYNDPSNVREPNTSSLPVVVTSLTGTFLSNVSYMTYRAPNQSSAAEQLLILTTSPVLSSTIIDLTNPNWGGSTDFWQLNQIPTSNLAASGLWSTATQNQGRLKGCLRSISTDEKAIVNGVQTHTGIINNSILIDSTVGYYGSFSNPVALLPHYLLTTYPETLVGDALKFPYSNSLTIIDSSKDGSRSVIRKKITNFIANDAVLNNVTYSFGALQTIFGNVYEATSKPGRVSGITGIMDGLVFTNPDGSPKYPYQDYVVTNTGKTYNNVYISDTRHGLILKYNILTKSISAIGTAGLPDLESNPQNIDPVFMMPPSIGTGALRHGSGIVGQSYITFNKPRGLALSQEASNQTKLYIADTGNHLIKRIENLEASSPIITTIAGCLSSGVLYGSPIYITNRSLAATVSAASATRFISISGREMGAALNGTLEFPTRLHLNTFTTNNGNISAHPFGTYIDRLSGVVAGPFVPDDPKRFRTLVPGDLLYISERELVRKLYLPGGVTANSTLSCVGNLSAAGLTASNVVFLNPGSPYVNNHLQAIYPGSQYQTAINPIIDVSGDNTGRVYYVRRFANPTRDVIYTVDGQEKTATQIFNANEAAFSGSTGSIKAILSDGVGSKIFIAGTQQLIETKQNYQAVWELLTSDNTFSNLFELAREQGQKTYPGANAYSQLAYDISIDKAIPGDKYLQMLNYDYSSNSTTRDTLYFSTYKLTDGFDLKVGMAVELYAATWNSATEAVDSTGNLVPPFTYVTAILDENRLMLSKPVSATSKVGVASDKIPTQYTSTGKQRLTAKFQRIDYRVLLPIILENRSNNITLSTVGLSAADTSQLKVGDYLIDIVEPSWQVLNGVLTETFTRVSDKYYPSFEENDKTEGMGKKHPRTIVEIPSGAGSSFKLSQRASFSTSVAAVSSHAFVMGLFYPGPGIAIGRNATTTLNSSLALGSPSQPLALNAPVPNQAIPSPARFVRVTVNGLDYMMPLYNIPDGL